MKKALLIYRGPLQRSRLRLVILSYLKVFNKVDFIWLLPNEKYHNSNHKPFDEFIEKFELNEIEILSGKLFDVFSCRKYLEKYVLEQRISNIALIGTSARFFVPSSLIDKSIWFINGIPEEKLLHSNSFKNRIRIALFWKSLEVQKTPREIITVSENMGEYLGRFFSKSEFYTVPSTVPIFLDHVQMEKKKYLVYSGSGAPWQWVEKLEKIWYELFLLDNSINFKVISRDKRVNVLKARIPESNILFVSAKDSYEVFEQLKDCKLGFLIRQDHLINRVASPIKFGEYLGAGCLVLSSDLKWAISDFIKEKECGFLVNQELEESEIAREVHRFLKTIKMDDFTTAKNAAKSYSLEENVERLISIIRD